MLVDKSTGILGDMLTNISTKYRSVFCQYGGRHSVNTVTFKCQQNIGQLSVVYWSTVIIIIQWKCCWKIDLTPFYYFESLWKSPLNVVSQKWTILLKRTNLRKTAFQDLIRYWVPFSRMHVYIWTNGLTHGKIFEQSLVGGRFWRFLKGELVGHLTI